MQNSQTPLFSQFESSRKMRKKLSLAFYENYSGDLDKHFEAMAFRPAANQFATIVQDITERKHSEAKIRNLAYFNQPTGLPNRASRMERLAQTLAIAERNRTHLALR